MTGNAVTRRAGADRNEDGAPLPTPLIVACAGDIVHYEYAARAFQAGTTDEGSFRASRAAHGVYEQREAGFFMVRGRVPAGTLKASQARAVAATAREVGAGHVHLTTRQDLQLHDVPEERIPAAMRGLLAAGFPTRASGGNTARNVTVCPLAGVCPNEVFDVTPVARELGLFFLAAGAKDLPRKFKTALSGCGCDCALAGAADLGFVARAAGETAGFAVHAGGGLGRSSRAAELAEGFIPVTEVLAAARALVGVFARHGDRHNRARARLRFVLDRLGPAAVLDEYREARIANPVPWPAVIPALVSPDADGRPVDPRVLPPWQWRGPGDGSRRFVPQRQPGLAAVPVHPPHGRLSADELDAVADLAARFGERGRLRLTAAQSLFILDVPLRRVDELAQALDLARPGLGRPSHLDHAVSCPGRPGCRLGICDAPATALRVAETLAAAGVPVDALDGMDVGINGCPNACALAPIAAIGLTGISLREGDTVSKGYRVSLGARRGAGRWRLGAAVASVPEDEAADVVLRVVRDFLARRRPGERLGEYLDREGRERWRSAAAAAA